MSLVIVAICSALFGGVFIYAMTMRHPARRDKKKTPSLTKYVAFSIAILIIYAIAEMVVSTISGVSHDTLTTAVYASFGGEILTCGVMKIFKIKKE